MDEADRTTELLVREYAEAGQITRQHEQLTRTSISVFLPTLIALAGYVVGSEASHAAKVVLALAGFFASILVWNIVRRHQLYYRSYIARARAIEESLKVQGTQVMKLYTLGREATNGSFTISNKSAFSILFILAALFFMATAALNAFPIVCRIVT